jgi:hypothetical protein
MTRPFNLFGSSKELRQKQLPAAPIQSHRLPISLPLSSRPASGDGGIVTTQAGSRGEGTQNYPHAENVIPFPTRSSLASVNSESPSGTPLFIRSGDLDHDVLCALAVMLTSAAISIACLFYAGRLIFSLVDLR